MKPWSGGSVFQITSLIREVASSESTSVSTSESASKTEASTSTLERSSTSHAIELTSFVITLLTIFSEY